MFCPGSVANITEMFRFDFDTVSFLFYNIHVRFIVLHQMLG